MFRKDLEPPELLRAMISLRDQGYSLEQIAKEAGMGKPKVSVYMRIPEPPEEIRDAFFKGTITFEHVKALSWLEADDMHKLFDRIREEGLSSKGSQAVAKLMKGKLEIPNFFRRGEFRKLLGRGIEFRNTNRGMTMTLKACDGEEMREILADVLEFEELQ